MTMNELMDHASEHAAQFGGFKTDTQLQLIKTAAARLSGKGDEGEMKERIERAVEMLICKGGGE